MDLVKHVILFSQALRARKVGVTVDNVMDALKGTSFVDIQKKEDLYQLLRSNFVSRKEEINPFNELFEQFWSPSNCSDRRPDRTEDGTENRAEDRSDTDGTGENEEKSLSPENPKLDQAALRNGIDAGDNRSGEQKEVPLYSPEEVLGRKDFGLLEADELDKVREFVQSISRSVAMRLARRWKKRKKGEQVDFRGSIRQSLRYGGEIVELKMKQRKQKPLRMVLLCDVSGSMDIYSQFFMLFMYGLQNYYPHCETFAFSTRLNRITPLLKRRSFEQTLRLLSENVSDWSGGTNIGAAMRELHQRHSDLLSPSRTIFLIFSDGWDRGDSALLDLEMENLKKHVRTLIWLNPLLESRDYQPVCKGMSTCLPYLDRFLPCHNFVSLKNLASHVDDLMRDKNGRDSQVISCLRA